MRNKVLKSVLSLTMAAALVVTGISPLMAASSDPNSSAAREEASAEISQAAATEGMVLLDNQDALPIAKSGKIALYGTGVYATVKGGTGSGDVYLKDGANIVVQEGFEKAGYEIVNKTFLAAQKKAEEDYQNQQGSGGMFSSGKPYYEEAYAAADIDAAVAAGATTAIYVLARNSGEGADRTAAKGDYYLTDNEKANLTLLGSKFDKVVVVLNVGGVVDTNFYNGLGGFAADDSLNRGKIDGLDALLLMSQAGQNGGHALVQVLNGTVNPSGKLTDTWAVNYDDYPSSAEFSFNDTVSVTGGMTPQTPNTLEEIYKDDIYVGYRYFDTYNKPVAYPFGYGSSYTDFEISVTGVTANAKTITVNASVKNTGSVAGKEVVQVYFSAPGVDMDKPYQELAGYKKVAVNAGATQNVTITFDTADLSSYDESRDMYVMEPGTYTIRVGNSSRNTIEAAEITLDAEVITEECQNNLGTTRDDLLKGTYTEGVVLNNTYEWKTVQGWFGPQITAVGTSTYAKKAITDILTGSSVSPMSPTAESITATKADCTISSDAFAAPATHTYEEGVVTTYVSSDAEKDSAKYANGKSDTAKEKFEKVKPAKNATLVDVARGKITMEQLVADMSNVELADLVEGGTYDGLSAGTGDVSAVIGSEAESVYGAAGETTSNLYISRYIPNIVMSDGPAGIRITNSYIKYSKVDAGAAYDPNQTYYTGSYSWGGTNYSKITFANEAEYKAEIAKGTTLYTTDGTTYYQYCTAFPIGTLLAQTWDPEVIETVGRAIGTEMLEYGVTSWLAPGMNIHRNPLCGRNFEYYSEDPLVCGKTASAETKGVQTDEDGRYRGIGVTLKHFAFNNQEESRQGSNSVVSERAAREIYLKGFEIGVKEAQPDYIMSSYNMVNGYSTFENYGLLTEILRNEWDFEGFVMTDWYSVGTVCGKWSKDNVQARLMYAGNDCEMPGGNVQSILTGLEDGSIMRLGDLQRSAIKMLKVIQKSAVFNKMVDNLMDSSSVISGMQQQLDELKKQLEEAKKEAESVANSAELKVANEKVASLEKELSEAKNTIYTDKKSYTVKRRKSVKITAIAANGAKVSFKSSSKKIAKVNKKGKVTGVGKGTATITITAGSATKTVKVKVK